MATNPDFNEAMFGEIKTRVVGGALVKSKDVRQKIKNNTLPALPDSRMQAGLSMCLAWHTKGMCNPGCPHAVDHVAYTTSQYQSLKAWCAANYPKDS